MQVKSLKEEFRASKLVPASAGLGDVADQCLGKQLETPDAANQRIGATVP